MIPPPVATRRWLSPGDVADELAIPVAKILAWIKSGDLRACNVAQRVGKRPRWRISALDLQLFLDRRSASPVPAPRRRRRADPEVTRFF